ncbi:MAG: prepilin peptidase [Candidatus Marsarchaeota archaeon]|nr:prepilin peptidase [Candidatus Marsarchaeota archaeon]
MTGLLIGLCALLGLAIGSFLNVVIYRVPRQLSVVSPHSACTSCGMRIQDRDNVPVVSWLILRGRCRNCNSPISVRYPLVELAGGVVFAGAAARIGFHWDLPAYFVMLASLLALALIDLEHLVLPKRIVYPSIVTVFGLLLLAAILDGRWHNLFVAVISAAAWFVVYFIINAVSPRALGFGDVRLAPLLGLGLGWLGFGYVILGFFSANLIGAIVGVVLITTKRMSRHQQIPYGVFLALGAALAIFAGVEILAPFQRF